MNSASCAAAGPKSAVGSAAHSLLPRPPGTHGFGPGALCTREEAPQPLRPQRRHLAPPPARANVAHVAPLTSQEERASVPPGEGPAACTCHRSMAIVSVASAPPGEGSGMLAQVPRLAAACVATGCSRGALACSGPPAKPGTHTPRRGLHHGLRSVLCACPRSPTPPRLALQVKTKKVDLTHPPYSPTLLTHLLLTYPASGEDEEGGDVDHHAGQHAGRLLDRASHGGGGGGGGGGDSGGGRGGDGRGGRGGGGGGGCGGCGGGGGGGGCRGGGGGGHAWRAAGRPQDEAQVLEAVLRQRHAV
jgi:hypothetical protein